MGRVGVLRFRLGLLVLGAFVLARAATTQASDLTPGAQWTELSPAQSGWSQPGLAAVQARSRALGSAAVVVVQHGAVVAAWGETGANILLNSARKSLASALIGIAAAEGRIDLGATMADLGIDDIAPSLTPAERQASVRDLLEARSGVYHPANYETAGMAAHRPARGSHAAGTFWYYNNWDFNVLGAIYEHATGTPIFAAFQHDIATPLGMQDFDAAKCRYSGGPNSQYPAYLFYASARDLARFGLLYLRQGRWGDRQIIPAAWVRDSIAPASVTPRGTGYGYLWWTAFPDHAVDALNLPAGSFFAWGNGGQFVFVIPRDDLVVVHLARRSDTNREGVSLAQMAELLGEILKAGPGRG